MCVHLMFFNLSYLILKWEITFQSRVDSFKSLIKQVFNSIGLSESNFQLNMWKYASLGWATMEGKTPWSLISQNFAFNTQDSLLIMTTLSSETITISCAELENDNNVPYRFYRLYFTWRTVYIIVIALTSWVNQIIACNVKHLV